MHYQVKPHGVCSRSIAFDLEGDVVHNVEFIGGCQGNLLAISRIVDGMTIDQIEQAFKGIDCGGRGTSCSDQFATLLRRTYEEAHA